jgi:putative salt-induced outer membrane protein YdiY
MKGKLSPGILKFIAVIILIFVTSGLINAEDAEENSEEKSLKYSSNNSMSLVLTRGNNESFSFSFDSDQYLDFKNNRINLNARFINATSNGSKKTDYYYSHLKYDRRIKSVAYLLGFIRYERNKLAGYNFRWAFSAGGGATWISRDNITLSSELALGWNNENNTQRIADQSIAHTPQSWEKTISTSFLSSIFTNKADLKVSESAHLILQETLFFNLENRDDYRSNSFVSLSVAINERFALSTSIQIIYQGMPVEGFESTDLYLLSSIVITI